MTDVVPCRMSGIFSRTLDGEAVLVNAEQHKVVVLNEVGARVWELADGEHTVSDMARVIAGEYEVSHAKAEADALAFCRELADRGLLTLDPWGSH